MISLAEQLHRYRDAEFSLEELAAAAGRLLRRLEVRSGDARVAAAPDERSIRFYQTAGIVDPPLRYDGRRAVYGFRHLLQLLAVKKLQQDGQPLALIQRGLAGRQTADLERAAGATDDGSDTAARPAPHAPDRLRAGATAQASAIPADGRPLVAVELGPGVTLTIDPARVDDPQALIARFAVVLARMREDG